MCSFALKEPNKIKNTHNAASLSGPEWACKPSRHTLSPAGCPGGLLDDNMDLRELLLSYVSVSPMALDAFTSSSIQIHY